MEKVCMSLINGDDDDDAVSSREQQIIRRICSCTLFPFIGFSSCEAYITSCLHVLFRRMSRIKKFSNYSTASRGLGTRWWNFYDVRNLLKLWKVRCLQKSLVTKGGGEMRYCICSKRSQQGQNSCGFSYATKCHFLYLNWAWILSSLFFPARHKKTSTSGF